MLRPKAKVLSHAALIPAERLIKPPPNQFTHELKRAQPYYYALGSGEPDGEFAAGARVVLLSDEGGDDCWVADAHGLHVVTAHKGLRRLTDA